MSKVSVVLDGANVCWLAGNAYSSTEGCFNGSGLSIVIEHIKTNVGRDKDIMLNFKIYMPRNYQHTSHKKNHINQDIISFYDSATWITWIDSCDDDSCIINYALKQEELGYTVFIVSGDKYRNIRVEKDNLQKVIDFLNRTHVYVTFVTKSLEDRTLMLQTEPRDSSAINMAMFKRVFDNGIRVYSPNSDKEKNGTCLLAEGMFKKKESRRSRSVPIHRGRGMERRDRQGSRSVSPRKIKSYAERIAEESVYHGSRDVSDHMPRSSYRRRSRSPRRRSPSPYRRRSRSPRRRSASPYRYRSRSPRRRSPSPRRKYRQPHLRLNALNKNTKNVLCKYFKYGTCWYGERCPYRHGSSEDCNYKYKTSLCRHDQRGMCINSSENCKFAHGLAELRNPIEQQKRVDSLKKFKT